MKGEPKARPYKKSLSLKVSLSTEIHHYGIITFLD